MKSSNYGLQISSSYINKFLKESLIYALISGIGAILLMFITIHYKFEGGISWYLDLMWKKLSLYFSAEVFSFNATESDRIAHGIIDKYWQLNLEDTHLFMLVFLIGFIATLIFSLSVEVTSPSI